MIQTYVLWENIYTVRQKKEGLHSMIWKEWSGASMLKSYWQREAIPFHNFFLWSMIHSQHSVIS